MGRSQFYRKIKALTNYSPVELMRRLRLKQARHLLTTTEKNISEIAYEVGVPPRPISPSATARHSTKPRPSCASG